MIGNNCTCPNGPMPGHYVGCPLAGKFGLPRPDHHELVDTREPVDPRPAFVLPEEINVLGQRFHLSVVEHPTAALDPDEPDSHQALGHCNRSRQTITIRGASALTEDKARETLLHEVIHAIIGTARISPFQTEDDTEEVWVSQLTPLLLDTLRDNPLLVAALISR